MSFSCWCGRDSINNFGGLNATDFDDIKLLINNSRPLIATDFSEMKLLINKFGGLMSLQTLAKLSSCRLRMAPCTWQMQKAAKLMQPAMKEEGPNPWIVDCGFGKCHSVPKIVISMP